MFLKRRVRKKDGKEQVHYARCESLRMHSGRVVQRRLFTDCEGAAPEDAENVAEVRLSSLRVGAPRRFGDCRFDRLKAPSLPRGWAGCRLWRELGLDQFWRARLGAGRGGVPWEKVLERLAVNRLLDPRSELFIHEK